MRRLRDEDDGAIAVIVAVLMVAIVGLAAIAIDVGALYSERRQLQNGTDAAVLAVAEDCASGDVEAACDAGPQGDRVTTAQTFANRNAKDGTAAVDPTPGVGVDVNYSESEATVTATSLNDGEGFVRHWFAPILGIDSTEVSAASTAIWGPVLFGSVPTLPLTFSQCEYDKFLASGAGSADEPWTEDNNGAPRIIYVHGDAEPCNSGPSGQDLPGGFGWLDTDTSLSCEALIQDNWVGVQPGNSPSQTDCPPEYLADNIFNQIVHIPVFVDTNGETGNNAEYNIATYAAFYVTGYNFGGQYKMPSSAPPCSGSDNCIAGWFTTSSAGGGVVDPNAPDQGLRAIQLVQN